MFPARPTTDPAGISVRKPTKKHTSEPTLQISHPKPKKNKQTHQNRLPNESPNPSKINENPTLDPKVSPLVSLWTHGSPTWSPKGKNQAPKVPKWSLKVSKIKVSDQTNHPCHQSTCQQLPVDRGPAAGAKP
jgi:hypothetical protein